MERLSVAVRQTPKGIVVGTTGEAGMTELAALNSAFKSVLEQKPSLVVFDLSGLSMIASAGMGALIAFRRDMGKAGAKVRLAAIRPQVHEALQRALFHKIFEIFDTVEAALG